MDEHKEILFRNIKATTTKRFKPTPNGKISYFDPYIDILILYGSTNLKHRPETYF